MEYNPIVLLRGFQTFAVQLPGKIPEQGDQTSRMQNWKEVNVWSSTVYSCDFHEGRQHFITLLMFVLNFVLFFNLFTLVIFMKVDNISSHC